MRSSVICTVDDASYVVISESVSQPTFHPGTKEHSPLYQGASFLQVLLLKKTQALFSVRYISDKVQGRVGKCSVGSRSTQYSSISFVYAAPLQAQSRLHAVKCCMRGAAKHSQCTEGWGASRVVYVVTPIVQCSRHLLVQSSLQRS